MTQSPDLRNGNTAKPAKNRGERFRDKTVTMTLSLPKIFFGAFFSLFVLVWVFIFGIMLGRGHNPEEVVPELAKVMPSPADPLPSQAPMDEVLQPRDLKYHDSLKGKNAVQPPRASASSPAPEPAVPAVAAPKPAEQPKSAKPLDRARQAAAQPPSRPATAGQDKNVYNYVYQVAAFNTAHQAQNMQKKLRDNGIPAHVSETRANDAAWFRVLVNFKGSPEDTRTLREKLAAQGVANVILRGKTPAR